MQMAYQGIDWDEKRYETTEDVASRQGWLDEKFTLGLDFPNLPYLRDGEHHMTETCAIHSYIADKFAPHLRGNSVEERAEVDMVAGVLHSNKMKGSMPCYTNDNRDEVDAIMREAQEPLITYLGDKPFLCGDNVAWVDFYWFEYLMMGNMILNNELSNNHPNVAAYIERMSALPGVNEYMASSETFTKQPFNMRFAKHNNWEAIK